MVKMKTLCRDFLVINPSVYKKDAGSFNSLEQTHKTRTRTTKNYSNNNNTTYKLKLPPTDIA